MTCGDCKLFKPARGPTGRVRPSEAGECTWTIDRSKWPMWTKDTHLYSRTTWAEVNATKCGAFTPIKPDIGGPKTP